ncbi:25893_t:CDS:2, partial [Gigaspora rosea]
LYKCEKLDISHAFEFEDQNSNEYNELNDSQITYLKALINLVSKKSIKEIWQAIPYMIPNS